MKTTVAKYIADFLVDNNITHNFTVTGGGAMFLNDAFGHHPNIINTYHHHEQAAAIAAEGYARLNNTPACVCVTTGPGGTNALTGVLGAWLDSIPMIVISGQVTFITTIASTDVPLRQLGDQEYNIVDSVKPMTKYAHMITEPEEIRFHLEKMLYLAIKGRPGPVWLDVPHNVQSATIETENLIGFTLDEDVKAVEEPIYNQDIINAIIEKIKSSKRPVIYAGNGIRLSGAYDKFLKLVDKLNLPVVTSWDAHDLMWDSHPCFAGRPGTVGTRGGNFVVENSDLLLVLGCRLNIRQISYNYKDFAKNAYKIMVDIDEGELKKPTLNIDMPICADVKDVIDSLLKTEYETTEDKNKWLHWAHDMGNKYPAALPEYYEKSKPMNPYAFMEKFFRLLDDDEIVVCGNGSAAVISFQAGKFKQGQRLITNSGCASMGYGFPAAIGCSMSANPKRVICIDGDGSFQMNLQELQTVVYNKLNLKILYINNNGYHSIRQTQTNLFKPPLVGVCDGNGLSFPDIGKIAKAYGIDFFRIDDLNNADEVSKEFLASNSAALCEVLVDTAQNFEPKLSSKRLPDGSIVSPPIDDMYPFLSREEYESNKKIADLF